MSTNEYYDEFGFYSPMPLTRAARREPDADFPTGPQVGVALPEIELPNQHGELVDVRAARGALGAIVVFHRSAFW